jgi:hypothetical protein
VFRRAAPRRAAPRNGVILAALGQRAAQRADLMSTQAVMARPPASSEASAGGGLLARGARARAARAPV